MRSIVIAFVVLLSSTGLQSPTGQSPVSPDPFSSVGFGTEATVLIVMAPGCAVCLAEVPFYQTLLELPRMDGKAKRLVVLAMGIMPLGQELDSAKFTPHLLTSGSFEATRAITDFPTVIVLNTLGKRVGTWVGKLTAVQHKEIVAVISSAR